MKKEETVGGVNVKDEIEVGPTSNQKEETMGGVNVKDEIEVGPTSNQKEETGVVCEEEETCLMEKHETIWCLIDQAETHVCV